MKIVYAEWEKRNMGVDTIEIRVEEGDTIEDLERVLDRNRASYVVLKLPSRLARLQFDIQENGFKYIESMVTLSRSTDVPKLTTIQERILSNMDYDYMSEQEKERLKKEIKRGMFSTDRIVIDPFFTDKQAQDRYLGWIEDEMALGGSLFNIRYKNESVGFFTLRKRSDGIIYSALAGMYQSTKRAGIGIAMDYFEIVEAKKSGGRKIEIAASTNNAQALSIPIQLNYSIEGVDTVFVKHII